MSDSATLPAKEELKRRQRGFIIINVITCLISLTAGLSLIFAPFLTIDATALISAANTNPDYEKTEGGETGQTTGISQPEIISALISQSGELKISFTPLTLAKYGSEENPVKSLLSLIIKKDEFENMFINAVGGMVILLGTIGQDDITEEDINKLNLEEWTGFIKKAETDEAAAREDFKTVLTKAAESFEVNLTEDFYEKADETFDNIIIKGKQTPDSAFSLEYLICSQIGDATGDEASAVTNYDELINYLATEKMNIESSDVSKIKLGIWIVFGAVFFPAVMWLLLALLSAFHILLKNKTFLTWYVKLTGFLPCLLFGIVPLVLQSSVSNAEVIAAIGTTTWLSGGCFIALALISLLFIYPNRRKIRNLKREVGLRRA